MKCFLDYQLCRTLNLPDLEMNRLSGQQLPTSLYTGIQLVAADQPIHRYTASLVAADQPIHSYTASIVAADQPIHKYTACSCQTVYTQVYSQYSSCCSAYTQVFSQYTYSSCRPAQTQVYRQQLPTSLYTGIHYTFVPADQPIHRYTLFICSGVHMWVYMIRDYFDLIVYRFLISATTVEESTCGTGTLHSRYKTNTNVGIYIHIFIRHKYMIVRNKNVYIIYKVLSEGICTFDTAA